MKKLFIVAFLIIESFSFFVYAQNSNYSAKIEVMDDWYLSPENYKATFKAEIYLNGNLIPADNSYFYEWHLYESVNNRWTISSGYGKNEAWIETQTGDFIKAYVVISGTDFGNITSPTVFPYTLSEQPHSVGFNAISSSGGTLNNYITPQHWRFTVNKWNNFNTYLNLNKYEKLKFYPAYVQAVNQKFNHWFSDETDVSNYKDFFITSATNEIDAQFGNSTGNATISIVLKDGHAVPNTMTISIKDPWLINVDDPAFYTAPYGYHNLGLNAPFTPITSPLNLSYSSKFQGVFLGQGYNQGNWAAPYYSVEALSSQNVSAHGEQITYYFQGWGGTDVQYQSPDNLETPVVFNAANAVAEARYKGHLASSTSAATGKTFYRQGAKLLC